MYVRSLTWMVALGILGMACAAGRLPAFSGPTNASTQLKRDTLRTISLYTACKRIEQVETAMLPGSRGDATAVRESDNALLSGTAPVERWQVTGCGKQVSFDVKFVPDGRGGAFISVQSVKE